MVPLSDFINDFNGRGGSTPEPNRAAFGPWSFLWREWVGVEGVTFRRRRDGVGAPSHRVGAIPCGLRLVTKYARPAGRKIFSNLTPGGTAARPGGRLVALI
jgi:hypothetical protein